MASFLPSPTSSTSFSIRFSPTIKPTINKKEQNDQLVTPPESPPGINKTSPLHNHDVFQTSVIPPINRSLYPSSNNSSRSSISLQNSDILDELSRSELDKLVGENSFSSPENSATSSGSIQNAFNPTFKEEKEIKQFIKSLGKRKSLNFNSPSASDSQTPGQFLTSLKTLEKPKFNLTSPAKTKNTSRFKLLENFKQLRKQNDTLADRLKDESEWENIDKHEIRCASTLPYDLSKSTSSSSLSSSFSEGNSLTGLMKGLLRFPFSKII